MVMTFLIVLAVASVCINILQWIERRGERAEQRRIIAQGAALEHKLDEVQALYDNEVKHREWAIGRIKDQQKVINQLERNYKPRPRKETNDKQCGMPR